jgi:hypothetical protein
VTKRQKLPFLSKWSETEDKKPKRHIIENQKPQNQAKPVLRTHANFLLSTPTRESNKFASRPTGFSSAFKSSSSSSFDSFSFRSAHLSVCGVERAHGGEFAGHRHAQTALFRRGVVEHVRVRQRRRRLAPIYCFKLAARRAHQRDRSSAQTARMLREKARERRERRRDENEKEGE